MIALMNTILNKLSTYPEFVELFVQRIPQFTEELWLTITRRGQLRAQNNYKSEVVNQRKSILHNFFQRFQVIFTIAS